jgi:long-chain acyl-CoA synthetase
VIEYQPSPSERTLMAFPLCHVAGYIVPVTHMRGGLIALMRAYEPEQWMRLVDEYRITGGSLAQTMVNFLLQHPKIREYDPAALKAGHWLAFDGTGLKVRLDGMPTTWLGPRCLHFGMTGSGKRAHVPEGGARPRHPRRRVPPLVVRHADVPRQRQGLRRRHERVPAGVVGEIVIQAEQVLKGTGATRRAQRPRSRVGGSTRRRGERDDEGFFYLVDRIKDMILTGGENVYSREVEEVIYTHPGVSEAAVIGLPDPTWGERVTAVVVLREGASATDKEIMAVTRDRLAGFKTPKQVLFIDELPRNVSGKILKRELRDRFSDTSN